MGCESLLLAALTPLLLFFGYLTPASEYANVSYISNGETLYAYVATPAEGCPNEGCPAAVVLHAWNGMGEEPLYFADKLAEQGFVAIAPDMFRGVAAPEDAILWNILTLEAIPQEQIDSDLDAALDYLLSNPHHIVDSARVSAGPGFCFGGSQALLLSSRRQLATTVSLYGSSTVDYQDPTTGNWGYLGAADAPVLGIYGALDYSPSPAEAAGFAAALEARNATFNVTVYPDVGHAFVNPEAHESGQPQAVAAWDQVTAFLSDSLASSRRALRGRAPGVATQKRRSPPASWPRFMRHLTWMIGHMDEEGSGHRHHEA